MPFTNQGTGTAWITSAAAKISAVARSSRTPPWCRRDGNRARDGGLRKGRLLGLMRCLRAEVGAAAADQEARSLRQNVFRLHDFQNESRAG